MLQRGLKARQSLSMACAVGWRLLALLAATRQPVQQLCWESNAL